MSFIICAFPFWRKWRPNDDLDTIYSTGGEFAVLVKLLIFDKDTVEDSLGPEHSESGRPQFPGRRELFTLLPLSVPSNFFDCNAALADLKQRKELAAKGQGAPEDRKLADLPLETLVKLAEAEVPVGFMCGSSVKEPIKNKMIDCIVTEAIQGDAEFFDVQLYSCGGFSDHEILVGTFSGPVTNHSYQ